MAPAHPKVQTARHGRDTRIKPRKKQQGDGPPFPSSNYMMGTTRDSMLHVSADGMGKRLVVLVTT